jgi:hypothetical protein
MSSHPITQQILMQVKSINVQLPDSVEDKWLAIENKEIELALHTAELGYRYMDLKESLGHGEFLSELHSKGLSKSRIYRYMDVARFFMESNEQNFPTLGNLKPSQIDVLTRLPEEEKKALTPEKIEEYGKMSVRTLRSEVKQLRLELDEHDKTERENLELKRRNERLEIERADYINKYNEERLIKAPEQVFGMNPKVAETRKQAVIINDALSELSTLSNHEVQTCINSMLDPNLQRDCAITLWYNLSAPVLQLVNSLNQLKDSFGEDVLSAPDNMPTYSKEELENALSLARLIRHPLLGGK